MRKIVLLNCLCFLFNNSYSQLNKNIFEDTVNIFTYKVEFVDTTEVLVYTQKYNNQDSKVGVNIYSFNSELKDLELKVFFSELTNSLKCETIFHHWRNETSHYYLSSGYNLTSNKRFIIYFKCNLQYDNIEVLNQFQINKLSDVNLPFNFHDGDNEYLIISDYKENYISKVYKILLNETDILIDTLNFSIDLKITKVSDIIYEKVNQEYFMKIPNSIIRISKDFDFLKIYNHEIIYDNGNLTDRIYDSKFLHIQNGVIKLVSESALNNELSIFEEEIIYDDITLMSKYIRKVSGNNNAYVISKNIKEGNCYIYYSTNVLENDNYGYNILKYNNIGEFVKEIFVPYDEQVVLSNISISENNWISGCGYFFGTNRNHYFLLSPNNQFIISGVIDEISDLDIKIYPNPTSDVLYFKPTNERIINVEIINYSGIYCDYNLIDSTIDISLLPIGFYYIRINMTNHKSLIRSIIKI